MEIVLIVALTVIIMIIAWIGNSIADKISDGVRNRNVRAYLENNEGKQERLADRYNNLK